MTSYFARTPRRKVVRWKATTPKLARLLGMPAKTKRKLKTEEHDGQDAAFEDRDGAWVRATYRTCRKCGVVNERVDATPRGPLGDRQRTAKFKVTA
jgi:hypothetical protein